MLVASCYDFIMNRADRTRIFCTELKDWFAVHKRTLPWRDLKVKDRNHRAYLVLVSEIMLQQTQVSRVIILYKNFIQTFPTMKDLSKASNREVLIAWKGLGYNSRALRLRDAAKTVVDPHPCLSGRQARPLPRRGRGERNGRVFFPESIEELLKLPGIGHYTAGAIRNFAFDLPTACIDTNIRRILHRCFVGSENDDGTWKKNDRYLLKLAEEILSVALEPPPLTPPPGPEGQPGEGKVKVISHPVDGERAAASEASRGRDRERGHGDWTTADFHAALMDFGSLVCTKSNPKWQLMPLRMRPIFKAYGKRTVAGDFSRRLPSRREPGREVAGKFIPNRIFRGRVIDALREEERGLTLPEIGKRITLDWSFGDHQEWLMGLLEKLRKDELIELKAAKYALRS